MVKRTLFSCLVFCFFCLQCTAQSTKIKRRSDSFFGVHFDFHARREDSGIGATLTPQMIDTFLTQVKPDYIQVDTKGHPGIASYPTTIGARATKYINDPLKLFREATTAKKTALYAHFSGVMDEEAVRTHPNWARINYDGKPDRSSTSIFGNYCDQYFIPQLKELVSKYRLDGVWVDGECWAVQADFSNTAKSTYINLTGKPALLNSDYMDFTRRAFHQYLNHYTYVIHRFKPKFQIASNWAFSSYMPGRVDAGVDFLSGDIMNDDLRNVEFEARVMANMGKPWDLMTWGFMGDKNGNGHYWKSAKMLEQKAAAIIAQGGGYSVYINQNRDASIQPTITPTLKTLAQFCRARKPYCFKSTAVPQIALLFSGAGHNYDLGTSTAFNQNNGGNDNIKGTLSMLLNSQYAVQVLQEFQLIGNLKKYPLLVITEWNYLEPAFIKQVEEHVYSGGKVLIIGGVTCGLFSKILPQQTVADKNNAAALPVKINTYGKGTIIGVDANISLNYYNSSNDKVRQTVEGLVKQLFKNPVVSVKGSYKVHVSVSKLNNKTLIHLINAGDRFDVQKDNSLLFQLPATNSLKVTYKIPKKPAQILKQPQNTTINFKYINNKVTFNHPAIDIYSIVEIKPL